VPKTFYKAFPSPMCGEAGLQTTAPADLAARAEADGIIPVAVFCVNIQMLKFALSHRTMAIPEAVFRQNQAGAASAGRSSGAKRSFPSI
jgi:hypothetical protein